MKTVFLTEMMKGNMMIFAPLCLLLCWMLPVDSMTIRFSSTRKEASPSLPLSMAEKSVDDMYLGCSEKMMGIIKKRYFKNEKRRFADAWNEAKKSAKQKVKQREDKALTFDHIQAICVYTAERVYKVFNKAVREEKDTYTSKKFQFHSLHFLLTSAVQILNSNNHCQTTYRRSDARLIGEVNQFIRFGSFASSSLWTNVTDFGRNTCFKIKTCLGAYLKNYSCSEDEEAEVLIPPYEMFKITDKTNGRVKIPGLKDCKVVYVLESVGAVSKLNCQIVYPSESSGSSSTRNFNNSYILRSSNSSVAIEFPR